MVAYLDVKDVDDCTEKLRAWTTAKHAEEKCLPRTPRDPDAPPATPNDVLHLLFFYEDLCQRYNHRELNGLLVASSIGPELVDRFVVASWYIHWYRANAGEDLIYSEWQKTLLDLRRKRRYWWSSGRRHWWSGGHPVYRSLRVMNVEFSIRAICTPPSAKTATSADWARASSLAKALALPTAFPTAIPAGRRPAKLKGSKHPRWTVVILPASLDQPALQQAWERAFAVALERRLGSMGAGEITTGIRALVSGQSVLDAFNIALPDEI